jgi:hypothetical protein
MIIWQSTRKRRRGLMDFVGVLSAWWRADRKF